MERIGSRWFRGFLVGVGVCVVVLIVNRRFSETLPGEGWDMGYGIAAASFLVLGALYGMRRRMPGRGPGNSRNWLQSHIYGGAVFLLLLSMHTGFRIPSGLLYGTMWLLSVWIVATGLAGVVIQRWVPRMLTSGLPTEVHYDRIPELASNVRNRAEALVAACSRPLQDFYSRDLAAAFAQPRTRMIYFVDITGGVQSDLRHFEYMKGILTGPEQERLDQLEGLFRTKSMLDAHYTLQKALRWWLYAHVPVSVLLLVLVVFHVFIVFS